MAVGGVLEGPDDLGDVSDPEGDPVMAATVHADAAFLWAMLPGLSAEDSFRILGIDEIDRVKLLEPTRVQLNCRGGVCWSHPAFVYRHVDRGPGEEGR